MSSRRVCISRESLNIVAYIYYYWVLRIVIYFNVANNVARNR